MTGKCTVTIENSGRTFTCGDELVLDAAIAQGIVLPYDCRGGACGTCKAEIVEGAVDHGWVMGFAITDEEIAAGRCLACSARPTTQRLVLRMLQPIPGPCIAQAGLPAEYACDVIAAHDLTRSVRRIALLLPSEAAFRFDGGMHVDVLADDSDEARPYSIAAAPGADGMARSGILTFLVARHPQGLMSSRLHDEVRVGGKLRIRGPYGRFRLPPELRSPVLMIAGGTGLAPVLSMVQQLLEGGYSASLDLLFSVRTVQDVFCLDQLHEIAARHANFGFRLFVTRDGSGSQSWERCRVPDYLAENPPAGHTRVFVAGSPGFVDACTLQLLRGGLPHEAVSTEAYTPRTRAGATVT